MALPTFNTKSPTVKRILREAAELSTNLDPTLHAAPLETDLFEWHFTIRGPPSTPYAAGAYHGRIVLPQQYPLRPPSFRFLTPSGRFETNREICLSISGHHEETWQPAWGIRTALWALRAFMEGGAKGQVGGMEMGEAERKRLAEESKSWKCTACGSRTNDDILREQQAEGGTNSGAAVVPDELKFDYKDQMQRKSENNAAQTTSSVTEEMRDATGNTHNDQTSLSAESVPENIPAIPSTTNSIQPQTSLTRSLPALSQERSLQPTNHNRNATPREASSQEAVPGWVDKAIIGLLATLFVMIIKKILV